jgi:hypothetical protein
MAGIPNNIVSILAVDNAGATTVIDVASFINSVQPSIPATTNTFAQPIVQRATSTTPPIVNNITTTELKITADSNSIPKVNSTQDNLINSLFYESSGKIGLNTNYPKYLLDVNKGSVNVSPLLANDGYKIGGLNIAYSDRSVATKEAIVMGDDTSLPRVNVNTLLIRGLIPSSPLGSTRVLGIDDYGVAKVAVAGVDYQDVIGYVPANAATTLTINGVSYDLYSNRTWSVGTVTSVSALTITSSGTDVTSTVSTPSVTPVITLNIPSSSATNRGVLTSADWATFNNKQAALSGTGFVKSTAGTISYDTSTYYLASNPSNYISANQSITLSGDVSGTGTTAITTALATITQASTGSFVKVTLDTKGRVTGNTAVLASDITGALTYTPVPTTRNLTINGTTYDLSADRSWTVNIGSTARNIIKFTATAGQTTFTVTGGYSVGLIDVYLNGSRLSGTDYTASNGTTVVLAAGVVAGDVVETVNYTSYAASSISGAGTTGYITKWTGSSAQGNSIIQDSGTAITVGGNITATSFIKSGGTSAQYLMADGSVSSGGGGTVSSVAALTLGTTGTDLSSTVANGTTTPVITLNVPTASATNRGALSSADWTTFNGKQASSTNLTSLSGLTYASASFVKMTASGTFALDTNTYYLASNPSSYITASSLSSYLPLAGGTMTGVITSTSSSAEVLKLAVTNGYISGWNTGATTRYGYLQWGAGSLNLASEAGAALNFLVGGATKILIGTDSNIAMNTTLTINSSSTSEVAGGAKIITHSKKNVGATKFIKIYAGTNNYFTGFIYGMNFDDYPPNSATSTGSGFCNQFGGYSDASGACGDKYFDNLHFGGNNVGGMGREMNTDGNGYIITATTSTGAGGFKCSATIMLFARDMSKIVITYY